MINTLRKVVLGVCFAAAVTALAGTVDTYAASKAEEAREAAIKEYKAEVEKVREAEKAQIKEIRDEAAYRTELEQSYADTVKYAEAYVHAVADQSRGLDTKAIKEAQEYAKQLIEQGKWSYEAYKANFKTKAEYEAFFTYPEWKEDMTEEEAEAYEKAWEEFEKKYEEFSKSKPKVDYSKENLKAYKKAYIRVYPEAANWDWSWIENMEQAN